MMASRFEIPAENLTWRCDLSFLPFTCTADMTPLEDFIGQDRAIRAIEFGLGVSKPGFNIFVTGLTGTGKTSIIKAFLKKTTAKQGPSQDATKPEDWCYVYNFTDADRPRALRIRRGWGKVLKSDMDSSCKICSARRKKCLRAMSTCANARR
jgi:ABC-type phosphonate transport system ATPase subunit